MPPARIAYWVRSRGPGPVKERIEVYVTGKCRDRQEGRVNEDLCVRRTDRGTGPYDFVVEPDDVENADGSPFEA